MGESKVEAGMGKPEHRGSWYYTARASSRHTRLRESALDPTTEALSQGLTVATLTQTLEGGEVGGVPEALANNNLVVLKYQNIGPHHPRHAGSGFSGSPALLYHMPTSKEHGTLHYEKREQQHPSAPVGGRYSEILRPAQTGSSFSGVGDRCQHRAETVAAVVWPGQSPGATGAGARVRETRVQ